MHRADHTSRTEGIKIALALQNEVQRLGIERMLESLDIVSELYVHDSARHAMASHSVERPDVLILALHETTGEDIHPALESSDKSRPKILLLLDSSNAGHLAGAADLQGDGFLDVQELNSLTLGEALHRLRDGEVPMPPRMAKELLAKVRKGSVTGKNGTRAVMTPREGQVLALLVHGLSNKQVARRLGISEHGVKRLVASILAKLNCANRTLAVSIALQEGLCEQLTSSIQ